MDTPILAIVYSDGIATDRYITDLAYKIRDAGVMVGGLVQRNSFVRDPSKCDMQVEELLSGDVLQISEYRGSQAKGCRLDRAVLAEAATLLMRAVEAKPSVLVVNKFGKVEAEGGGLRDAIIAAVHSEIPLIVGVPYRNLDQWRVFAGDFAKECRLPTNLVDRWLADRGIAASSSPAADEPDVCASR